MLEKGLLEHQYEQLMLVAPPHFLGTLKGTVSTQVSKHIEATLDKDYTSLPLADLEERILSKLVA